MLKRTSELDRFSAMTYALENARDLEHGILGASIGQVQEPG
jgi:hypothetical protein